MSAFVGVEVKDFLVSAIRYLDAANRQMFVDAGHNEKGLTVSQAWFRVELEKMILTLQNTL
jgi:hypothetical protein